MYQYMKKEEEYTKHFLSSRLPKVVLPFAVAIVLYYAAHKVIGLDISLMSAFQSFLIGEPFVSFSWYVIAIIFFYLVFYVSTRVCKDNYKYMILMISAGLLIYSFVCYKLDFDKHWYKTCTSFLLGIIWGVYNEPISEWLEKKWVPAICLSLLGFLVFFYQIVHLEIEGGYYLLAHYLSSAFFCITVAAAGKKVRLSNRLLMYIGDISYEIYLIHGWVILFLRNDNWFLKSDFLFAAAVLLGSPLAAMLFNRIDALLLQPSKCRGYIVSAKNLFKK